MLNLPFLPEIFLGVMFLVLITCGIVEFIRAPRGRLLTCFVLRAGAVLMLYMIFSHSGMAKWEKSREGLKIVMLRDVSDSMGLLPEETRRELDGIYGDTRRALEAIPETEITELVFASETAPAEAGRKPAGGTTAIGDALTSLMKRHSGAQIFLLSDGRSNRGGSPAAAASFLKNQGSALHVFSGSRNQERDYPSLSFGDVNPPDTFDSEQPSVFTASTFLSGVSNEKRGTLKAELLIDGKRAAEVRLDADAPVKELQFTPADASLLTSGWHEFEIKAELAVSGSPAVARSYQDVFQVPVENAAMLLWNRMDPELNALLPLLRGRYQPFHFSYATLFGRLPEARQLKRIDSLQLLMLGPVQPDALPLNVRKRIARKLHEKTLTLLFLSPSVLNAWSRDPEIGVYVPASSASVLRLPPGTKYSFTAGSRNYDLPVTAFRRMIPKPSAVAKQTLKMRNLSLPLLLSSGNVSAFALAGTWRWRLSPDRSLALAYAPYWNMMLAACDNFDKSDLHFSITPADPLLADDLYRFTVEDYSKEPVRELYLLRQTEDGRTMKRLYRFGKAEKHVYSTLLKITEPGIWWFQAEDGRRTRRSRKAPLTIRRNEKELLFSTPDQEVLRMFAALGGGSVIRRETIRDTIGKLKKQAENSSPVYRRKQQDPPYRLHLVCALLACALLSAEWLLRKMESNHV